MLCTFGVFFVHGMGACEGMKRRTFGAVIALSFLPFLSFFLSASCTRLDRHLTEILMWAVVVQLQLPQSG